MGVNESESERDSETLRECEGERERERERETERNNEKHRCKGLGNRVWAYFLEMSEPINIISNCIRQGLDEGCRVKVCRKKAHDNAGEKGCFLADAAEAFTVS